MLKSAIVTPHGGLALAAVDVSLMEPAVEELTGRVLSVEYEMEYQTVDLPSLKKGDGVVIESDSYTVREPPRLKGDGYFSAARLTLN